MCIQYKNSSFKEQVANNVQQKTNSPAPLDGERYNNNFKWNSRVEKPVVPFEQNRKWNADNRDCLGKGTSVCVATLLVSPNEKLQTN